MPRCVLTVVSLLIMVWPLSGYAASYSIRKVAAAGENAPQGGTFAQFDPAANPGAILFDGLVMKDHPFHGLFVTRGNALSRVVAVGDPSPLGGTFIDLSFASMNRQGNVAFLGSALGGVAQAVYLGRGGESLKKIVAVNEGASGGGVLQELSYVALGDGDAVAFSARVERGPSPKVLFLAADGRIVKIAAAGDPSPTGGRFSEFINLWMNGRGEMVFEATEAGGASPSGIFVATRSGVRKVVSVGDASPLGGSFKDLALPLINERGDVVFWASLEESPSPAGLFLASGGTVTKVAARGDSLPGGGRLSFIGLSYSFNERGAIAFEAAIVETDTQNGIFVAEQGRITPVVRSGDPTPLGGRFTHLTAPEVGPDGSVAFAAGIEGGQSAAGLFLAVPNPQ